MNLLDQIPGYREAVEKEREQREIPFIDAPEIVCGVEVLPMTFWHLNALRCIGSPFIVGKLPQPQDVPLFLWIVSPWYEVCRKITAWTKGPLPKVSALFLRFCRYRFIRRNRKLPFLKAVNSIYKYCEDALQDSSGGPSGFTPSYYSNCVPSVIRFASELHFSEREILNMPLKKLFQYSRGLQLYHKPNSVLFNPSDKVRGDWLAAQNRN